LVRTACVLGVNSNLQVHTKVEHFSIISILYYFTIQGVKNNLKNCSLSCLCPEIFSS
jgi:hypothetical protein